MARSALIKDLGWRFEVAGYDLFSALLRLFPTDAVSAAGAAVFKALGPLTGAHRTARLGLTLAYPDLARSARKAILAAQWDNFGRYVFEFPLTERFMPAFGRVEVEGMERLAAIAASGRPAVLISGHFSNFEVMAAVIVAAGIRCNVTYRAANNPYVDRRIINSRRRYGVTLFAPKGGEGARELIEAMNDGRSIAMLNDQRYDSGIAGPFFGRRVMTNPAAVRLALRFSAPIQPMSIERLKGARFRCVIHAPIEIADTGRRAADMAAGVAKINAFIEARVREHPGEWWWLHRRWSAEDYRLAAEIDSKG
ncbi:MAG TPA: lysophospholipid acyltransferase family protein [Caulobacteraceae bacterium]|jgi:KDO2-lipid IV(A) lauroyltransferase|nr:lysophospholipid acyltransferase family protein [Caulobacteraceae bacterium]